MNRVITYIFLFNFVYTQYINQETGWSYHQSSNQSFYIFEQIQIDGESAVGDGWASTLTEPSECVNNPDTCDVIGAFINDICVGWVYADFEGETTLPVMGYDNTNSQIENFTIDYCNAGDTPEIQIYDASSGTILSMIPGNQLPGWQNNFANIIFDISFANNGIYNSDAGWYYYQSSEQAFYLFETITINGLEAESSDIIGAFKDEVCVGWITINDNGYTSVPVMGSEIDNLLDYMNVGEIPIFRVYDQSENEILDVLSSDIILPWNSNDYFIIDGVSESVLYDCLDPEASNYNPNADLQCESCCIYEQTIEFISGWNMFSLNVNPIDTNLYNILVPIHNQLDLVLDETGSAIFPDESGEVWTDNIGDWFPTEGYLIKVLNDIDLSISNNGIIFLPLDIPLTGGWNIISYPNQQPQNIEEILSSLIISGNLYSVFDEGGNVFIPDIVNSIFSFNPGEAYYVKVNYDDTLTINNSDFFLYDPIVDESLNRTEHFSPIWSGNPFSPMTIFLDVATWNNFLLNEGDEIGIFDGSNCVGAGVVPSGGFVNFDNFQIVTSKDDGSGNGYIEGNDIIFRVWRDNEEIDIDVTIDNFSDELGNAMQPIFESLRAPFAQINVYSPSSVSNFDVLASNNNQINLTWDRPEVGDYQIYNYPDPGSYNAITFTITGDSGFYLDSLDAQSIIDSDLNNNTNYTYEIEAVSIVGISIPMTNDALTMPGTPILNLNGATNQIILMWEDPDATGSDAVIDYEIQRQWNVGDITYSNIDITNNDDDNQDHIYVDDNLLNSTEYSYRIRSHNLTGYSSWTTPYLDGFTSMASGNLSTINNIQVSTYQVISPPNNVINFSWDDAADVSFYHIYEANLLLDVTENSNYIDPSFEGRYLQTSTLYQYIITGVNAFGEESAPSALVSVNTLPEYIPDKPDSIMISPGQNQIELTWNEVLGYGYPIGGDAATYNIYRFNVDEYDSDNILASDIIGATSSSSYIDSHLDDNLFYCYGVTGVNAENSEGPISEVLCDLTYEQLPASIPLNLVAYGGNRQVSLFWEESFGSPGINYQIYRSSDGWESSYEFVASTSNTNYIDMGLSSNTNYGYYISAWNELGPSNPSETVFVMTDMQTNILAADSPQDLLVSLDDDARASNYIDGYAQLEWDAQLYSTSPFSLVYSGNPYSPHTIIIQSIDFEDENIDINDGDVIGIFDNQLCVGLATWPLSGGQMSASKDDGTGNGFTEGNNAYFKIWDFSTGHVSTVMESPLMTFSGLGLDYISLDVRKDSYNIYRNGEELVANYDTESYQDNSLESAMEYVYSISAVNDLGVSYESNVSTSASINTYSYPNNAPVLSSINSQQINEDSSLIVHLSASDLDGDQIIYFVESLLEQSPISYEVVDDQVTITPAPNHFGSWDIKVTAYDDSLFYESNTLTDTIEFELIVDSVNDSPRLLNPINDIEIIEGDYQDYLYIDLEGAFIDADIEIMNDDPLLYTALNSDNSILGTDIVDDLLQLQILSSGTSDIYLNAIDQHGLSASDTINILIQSVLSADDIVWPEKFSISNVYPNPFNPSTSVDLEIPISSNVDIKIYNIQGNLIDQLFSGYLPKGYYSMQWNAHGNASGVYFVSMLSDYDRVTKKVILLK